MRSTRAANAPRPKSSTSLKSKRRMSSANAKASASDNDEYGETSSPEAIRLYIPRELYMIPLATTNTGLVLGFLRGSRQASLRYLAENAHRAPKTVEEWYFYHKTKNYRVLLGGLKQSGKDGLRLGATGVVWVGIEQATTRVGLQDYKEICAGVGLAGAVAAVCKSISYQNSFLSRLTFFCRVN